LFGVKLRVGSDLEYDDDGLEMPNLDTAYLEAFEAGKEMWIDAFRTMENNPTRQQFEISNGEGRTLLTVPLREVLDSLKGAPKPPPMQQAERAAKLSHEVKDAVETARNSLEEARRLLARLPV
jgi:hypothetical protein